MFHGNSQFDLAEKSLKALNRLRNSKDELLKEEESRLAIPKVNYAKFVFEEYDDESFEKKIKMDSAYYNVLLNKLDESHSQNVQTILSSMLSLVKTIYETINVKPKIYGLQRLNDLNESQTIINQSASRIISDYITRNYYRLTQEERENKYLATVKRISKDMIIDEGIEPQEAVAFSLKTAVIDELLEHINFPMTVKNEIESNLTSTSYAQMFDPQILKEQWENYQSQSLNISKIISAIL